MRVLILGASFAGLPAAFRLRRHLPKDCDVTVLDKRDAFTFTPSLIWVPFGRRSAEQITVPLRPALERRGIEFLQEEALRIEPEHQAVATASRRIVYDRLLVATGPSLDFSAVPGLGLEGPAQSLCTLEQAMKARDAWRSFLEDPGPIVIGGAQRSAFLSAAYEFAFNLDYDLREVYKRRKVEITFLTPEPYLGHLGIGDTGRARGLLEWFFRHANIDWVVQSVIDQVTPDEVRLGQGSLSRFYERQDKWENVSCKGFPFKYAMIMPPMSGAEVVKRSGLGNQDGFIVVDEYMRHKRHPEIFAAGVSVAVTTPQPSQLASSAPKTGYISRVMAKTAARNIAASLTRRPLVARPVLDSSLKLVLDAGDQGLMMFLDHIYQPKPRQRRFFLPGWWAHWAKVSFEKQYLWKTRAGLA